MSEKFSHLSISNIHDCSSRVFGHFIICHNAPGNYNKVIKHKVTVVCQFVRRHFSHGIQPWPVEYGIFIEPPERKKFKETHGDPMDGCYDTLRC